ncbi:MAG: hypothetical protein AAFR38_06820 [Planctomycetota bacterium]
MKTARIPALAPSLALCLATTPALLAGCIASGSTKVKTTGTAISGTTLTELAPTMTESEVVELLGAPTRVRARTADDRVLVYEYKRKSKASGNFLLLFGGSKKTVERRTAFIEIDGGFVASYWVDGDDAIERVYFAPGELEPGE